MKTFSFEKSHSCVQIRENVDIYVQCMDQYSYQRELIISQEQDNEKRVIDYKFHSYMHPYFREITLVEKKKAEQIIKQFMEYVEKYPSLLFNEAAYNEKTKNFRPQNAGFVRFHNKLLAGLANSFKVDELL